VRSCWGAAGAHQLGNGSPVTVGAPAVIADGSWTEVAIGAGGKATWLVVPDAAVVEEGGRRFNDEFRDLTRQAHGECAPGCWCHTPEGEGRPCPSETRAAAGA
jgi:hypothetical protein